MAFLSHLKQIIPPDKNKKRVRFKCTLAECLTLDEVRMREDEAHKQEKHLKKGKKNSNVLTIKTAVSEVVINTSTNTSEKNHSDNKTELALRKGSASNICLRCDNGGL